MSRTFRALRSTVIVSAFGYAAQALSVVAIPLYLSTVGAEAYGLMVTVLAFMGYLGFADAGLSWGSLILVAQAHGRGSKLEIAHIVRHSAVLAAGSCVVVAFALGMIFLAASFGRRLPMFAQHSSVDLLLLMAGVQLAANFLFGVFNNIFHGLQESYWPGFYQGLGRVLGLAGSMIAAWLTHNIAVVLAVQLAFSVASGVAAAVHVWRRHPWAFVAGPWRDRAQYSTQLRIGAKTFLLQIGRTLGGTAPTLGISSILGPASVPLYTVPTTLLNLFFTPINSWNATMVTAYGEAWVSGSRDWVREVFRHTLERALLLGGLGVGLFLALGDTFVRAWTHQRLWVDHGMAASVAGVVVFGALLSAGQFLLSGLNRHRQVSLAELVNGGLSIVLVVLSVHWWGLNAVGIGVVGAALATSSWVVWREVRTQLGAGCFPSVSFVLKIFVAMLLGGGAAALAVQQTSTVDLRAAAVGLAVAALCGLVLYLAFVFAVGLIALDDVVGQWRRIKQRFQPSSS